MPMSTRDRRALIIFSVVAVAAVAAYFLLLKPGGSGGTGGSAQPVAVTSPQTHHASSPTPAPSVKSHKGKPRRSQPPAPLVGGRDPFSPLVNASAGGGTGPAPSGGGTSPAPSGTVAPPASPPATPSGGTGTRIGGHSVTLLGIFTHGGVTKAQISLDGTTYVVAPGSDFDGNFRLVSLSAGCARILYGDQAFSLCENPQK